MSRRWPDLIIEADGYRRAVVVESAPVPGKKLAKRILDYVCSEAFDEVVWLVPHEHAKARLENLIEKAPRSWKPKQPEMRVLAYWTVSDNLIAWSLADVPLDAASDLSSSPATPAADVPADVESADAPSLEPDFEAQIDPSGPTAPEPETDTFRNRFSRLLGPGPGTRFFDE